MDLSAHLGSRTIQSGTVLEHQLGGVVKCYLHRDVCMVNLSVKIDHRPLPTGRQGWKPGPEGASRGCTFPFQTLQLPNLACAHSPRKQWPDDGAPRKTDRSNLPRIVSVLARKVLQPRQARAVSHPKRSPNILRTPHEPALTRGFLPRGSQPSKGSLGRLLDQATLGFESPVLPVWPIVASDRSLETWAM